MQLERARISHTCVCRKRAEIAPRGHHQSVTLRSRLLPVALAATVLVSAATAALPRNGFYGVVRKGPIAPVCRQGIPCDAPVQVTLIFSRAGSEVARTRSSTEGRYRIRLPAGYYTVRTLERIGIDHSIRPRNVHVRSGHVDRLDFSIDTGIR
jgi:hypothetical protein